MCQITRHTLQIKMLKESIASLRADNARYETGEFCRERLRRPIKVLRDQIFRYFRRNFDHPEESIKKMLEQMYSRVEITIERFRNIPTPVVHKCFKASEKEKTFEAEVARQMDVKNEHDQRSQKLYYKSINPPEIIWGRPATPHGTFSVLFNDRKTGMQNAIVLHKPAYVPAVAGIRLIVCG